MKLCLKITAGLLLLVQAIHLASLQSTTGSSKQPMDPSWLREFTKNTAGSQNSAVAEEETEYDPRADASAAESSNDYSSGIASGYMTLLNAEDENATSQEQKADEGFDDLTSVTTTVPPTVQNDMTKQPEMQNTTVSPTNATTYPTNSSQSNKTDTEEEFHNTTASPRNSTTHLSMNNSTGFPDSSNHTELQTTTLAPEGNDTQESTTKPDEDTWSTNATESTNKTTVTTTETPEINETTTTSPSTTVFPSETTDTSPETTTTVELTTSEKGNLTDKGSAAGSSSDRGLDSDSHRSKRKGAWAAVLGTMVAVVCVGLAAYFILKKKHRKGFTHRKLVEEYPSDPVLRLDNSDPLDLNFGGSAYYNPGLQGDNIQMTNIPGRY